MPWPPSYAGAPVNAATGKPIQSFQDWQAANPAGMSINSTPAAPAAPQSNIPQFLPYSGGSGTGGAAGGENAQGSGQVPGGQQSLGGYQVNPAYAIQQAQQQYAQQQQGGAAPQAQASAAPNNWQAALSALANPGNPVTQGANVPQATGSQPSGGVNNAFLQQAGAGQGMNQNFLNSLRAIQARPQG
jgi:hypothetical protein